MPTKGRWSSVPTLEACHWRKEVLMQGAVRATALPGWPEPRGGQEVGAKRGVTARQTRPGALEVGLEWLVQEL
jgi:hypothetical protein